MILPQGDVFVDLTDMSVCLLCHCDLEDDPEYHSVCSFCPRCAFCIYQTRFVDGGAFQSDFVEFVFQIPSSVREEFLSAFHAMLPSCICGSVGGHTPTCSVCNRRSQIVMFGFCYESEPIRRF